MGIIDTFLGGYGYLLYVIAKVTVYTLELIGIMIIIVGSIRSVLQLLTRLKNNQKVNIIIGLGKTLAIALEFKMGAEIVNTVIVRDLAELGTIAVVIALRAVLSLIIHWEIKNEKKFEKDEEEERILKSGEKNKTAE